MELSAVTVHIAAFCYLFALLMSHMMWLRVFILFSTVASFSYALQHQYLVMAAWQALFFVLNGFNLFELWRGAQKIHLNARELEIYSAYFSHLKTGVFRLFWSAGETKVCDVQQRVCQNRMPQEYLYFLLKGSARVYIDGKLVKEINAGHFFGEMAFLKKKIGKKAFASADVILDEGSVYHVWDGDELLRLLKLFQDLDFFLVRQLEKLVYQKMAASGKH